MKKLSWFVLCFFALVACNLTQAAPTSAPQPPATVVPSATATEIATALPTDSPTPAPGETETPPAATIPPLLTSIPGIAATLTAVASTPGAENTLVAQQTMMAATLGVKIQGLSSSLEQCPNPSDPPMQKWVDIPVMPQATAGQVVETLIGSYYCFRAPVTVEEMETFYKEKLQPQGWALQADANGAMEFVRLGQTGGQLLFLNSGPGKKNDLIVVINVTIPIPISIPTPKP
jgi:hypothetical protein